MTDKEILIAQLQKINRLLLEAEEIAESDVLKELVKHPMAFAEMIAGIDKEECTLADFINVLRTIVQFEIDWEDSCEEELLLPI